VEKALCSACHERDAQGGVMDGAENTTATGPCRLLALDGGGAKGFYTLGVLTEIEAMVGHPLCESFDLIFGTSTGAIIAALLALGKRLDEIHVLYKEHVPKIMRPASRQERSAALADTARIVFGDARFEQAKTGIGIVATRWDFERPMIFKASVAQAHGRHASFSPGFGCSIADAVQGSCSAYPFFERKIVTTSAGDKVELVDGGYCANNPTLYAIADAVMALKREYTDLRVVNVGVGTYPQPKGGLWRRLIGRLESVQLLQKTLNINTTSMDQLRTVLFKQVPTIRISETFERPEMATDLMEHDLEKLNTLFQRGRESFAKNEAQLKQFLM
jgi:predicted acylesterase/phospholipase RssA